MVAMLNLSLCEKEFFEAHILSANKKERACDPFGLASNQEKAWTEAKEIDRMFLKKIHKGAVTNMGQEMFHCVDCDSFIACSNKTHDVFVRCFGTGEGHCGRC